jgi:hypothetical protein
MFSSAAAVIAAMITGKAQDKKNRMNFGGLGSVLSYGPQSTRHWYGGRKNWHKGINSPHWKQRFRSYRKPNMAGSTDGSERLKR